MAGDPAITKIVEALSLLLTTVGGPNIFPDRDGAEPLQESELPAIVINVLGEETAERPELGFGSLQHRATLQLDFYDGYEAFTTITAKHRAMIADAIATIGTDPSLGGRLRETNFIGVSKADDVLADQGCAVLEIEIVFDTQLYDWTVGIGQSGPF